MTLTPTQLRALTGKVRRVGTNTKLKGGPT